MVLGSSYQTDQVIIFVNTLVLVSFSMLLKTKHHNSQLSPVSDEAGGRLRGISLLWLCCSVATARTLA